MTSFYDNAVWTLGTITVASGATTITGSGTYWITQADLKPGAQIFGTDGGRGVVKTVAADGTITIWQGWTGTGLSGEANNYMALRGSPYAPLTETVRQVTQRLAVGLWFDPAYVFSSSTTMADPAAGNIRFNHATAASVTAIAIDDLSADSGSPDVSAWVTSWSAGGVLIVRAKLDPAKFAMFDVTSVTDNAGWTQLTVTHLAGPGGFTDAEGVVASFSRGGTGDVVGPGSATADNVTLFNGPTGKLIRNSSLTSIAMADKRGACQLALSGGNLILNRLNGRHLVINGVPQLVPATPPSFAPTGKTPGILYYVYAYMSGSNMLIEAISNAPALDATTGMMIKTGDATRTLVGAAYCKSGPAWADSATSRLVLSYFNRRHRLVTASFGNNSTTSTSEVQLGSGSSEFITWADEMVDLYIQYQSVFDHTFASVKIGVDGAGFGSPQYTFNTGGLTLPVGLVGRNMLAVGYHTWTLRGACSSGSGTLTVNNCSGYGAIIG